MAITETTPLVRQSPLEYRFDFSFRKRLELENLAAADERRYE